jgi:hypothetical protein
MTFILFKFHYFGSISFAEKFYRFEVDCFVREDERKEGATSKVAKSKKIKGQIWQFSKMAKKTKSIHPFLANSIEN